MSAPAISTVSPRRWWQLVIGVICMVMIANLQYGWTLFVRPINQAHGWSVADIQIAFSIFVALETWLTPFEGWLADRFGPKFVIAAGGVLVAIGWIINSMADSLALLYVGAAVTGTGAGAVYATCIGNAVKWFPDRRGLAVGLTAAGFGAGAALTIIPIRAVIAAGGYQTAFFWFGLVQGAVVFLLAWLLRAPLPDEVRLSAPPKIVQSAESYAPLQVLASPLFWVLYIMFILVSASGLMATAQVALIAKDFNVADTVILFGATTLTLALIIDSVANGSARPLFGWVSDHIGRENTMAIAFGLGGISYWLLGSLGTSPWAFVVFAALIFLTWGEIFSLFPSTCTDIFGPKFATANLSLLYTAKGASAFLVPLANVLKSATGSWHAVFVVTAVLNFVVVAMALFVLKPLRSRRGRIPAQQAVPAQ
ncbi:MAG: oxalate/formate MFS antiporter [Alphaproteobacteria bacterium]|nr:oxalate/formate MFS antiporter [Alphaproteobacteria bacterium]MBV9151938.1 oxalate/formate MFS antiporter [Alphaproteobacteria bacterium]MBV9585849.1 oxalate/formate MFS antiporter [Alphaproteobacteria bacterium]MBV9965983.1 oxalate/formate MFS antiporter [Alphaproteobacteria bacterium]